jgi:hypothetical protein
MRLFRRIALVVAIGSTIGCHDASGPTGTPSGYRLVGINGRSLPTLFSPIPEAPTITYGTLWLDGVSHAVITEHRKELTGQEISYTTDLTYTITGDVIQFEYNCPPNALCARPPRGVFVNYHLLLDMSGGNNEVVYDYMLVMPD